MKIISFWYFTALAWCLISTLFVNILRFIYVASIIFCTSYLSPWVVRAIVLEYVADYYCCSFVLNVQFLRRRMVAPYIFPTFTIVILAMTITMVVWVYFTVNSYYPIGERYKPLWLLQWHTTAAVITWNSHFNVTFSALQHILYKCGWRWCERLCASWYTSKHPLHSKEHNNIV